MTSTSRGHYFLVGLVCVITFLIIYNNFWSNSYLKKLHFNKLSKLDKAFNKLNSSKCSERATLKGGNGQKVVSFSLYEGKKAKKKYSIGIVGNYNRMQEFYPGWLMRVYTDIPAESGFFEKFNNLTDLYFCDVKNLPVLGDVTGIHKMIWRFLPINDPTVSIFLSRDLDSLIFDRERSAVAQWETSDKAFHAMRDHILHGEKIMGGLWGAKNYVMNGTMRSFIEAEFLRIGGKHSKTSYGSDQGVLAAVLYRKYKDLFMIHDSYHCRKLHDSIPFPEQRKNVSWFVGGYAFGGPTYRRKASVCPKACRPKYGQDWKFC